MLNPYPIAPGAITDFRGPHRFLSNFFEVSAGVRYGDLVGPTVEHVFQAAKTTDEAARQQILHAPSPGQAKRLGRRAAMRSDWNEVRLEVMAQILESKFADPRLVQLLVSTGERQLVESNVWGDRFWGVDMATGVGANHLGETLMKVRHDLLVDNRATTDGQGSN